MKHLSFSRLGSRRIPLLLVLITSMSLAGCGGTPVPSACPPITGPITANVAAPGDVSSITIPNGATAEFDGGGYWCDTAALAIETVDVNALVASYGCFTLRSDKTPPCSPSSALAAVDVSPDDVKFPSPPKPQLRYDLDAHVPQNPDATNFGIYQLKAVIPAPPSTAWRWVGSATPTTYSSKSVAQGSINHMSVFALVELPPPAPVTPPFLSTMIIDSDFLDDDQGIITVAFAIREVNFDQGVVAAEETRIFRLTGVDPAYADPNLPAECLDLDTPAAQLTCLFPVDTSVEVELGIDGIENLMRILSLDQGYEARLFANVEIH